MTAAAINGKQSQGITAPSSIPVIRTIAHDIKDGYVTPYSTSVIAVMKNPADRDPSKDRKLASYIDTEIVDQLLEQFGKFFFKIYVDI